MKIEDRGEISTKNGFFLITSESQNDYICFDGVDYPLSDRVIRDSKFDIELMKRVWDFQSQLEMLIGMVIEI